MNKLCVLDWKKMRNVTIYIIILVFVFYGVPTKAYSQNVSNLLLVTSDRKTPSPGFYELFNSLENFHITELKQPQANEAIEKGYVPKYDIIVFYDLNDSITEAQKAAYWDLLENGIPLLFLHHTLVSYQKWPDFIKIIGGRYNRQHDSLGPSGFIHDYKLTLHPSEENHPITQKLTSFSIIGEAYNNCEILPEVTPLLICNDSKNIPVAAWIHKVKNSEVVYIQNGHDDRVFNNIHYQKLIQQAVLYLIFHTK